MEKTVEIGLLIEFYKNILTEKQAEAVNLYYNDDLSLAEIADILGITRQGVRDNIKRAENVLYKMEEDLGLVKKFLEIKKDLEKVSEISETVYKKTDSEEIKELINEVIDVLQGINDKY